jgi:hypothetical protein
MAYTPSPLLSNQNPPRSNFGGQVVDSNRVAMPYGSNIQTQDATASPVASPLVMSGSVQTLTKPTNATQITITAFTSVVDVSEDSTMSVYDVIPVGGARTYDVSRQQFIYLKGTSPNLAAFVFKIVQ